MVNTSPPPEQETNTQNRHIYIPPEILEQIFKNLSLKPLLRFSSVAASWNSTITSPRFTAKHGGGRKMVIINDNPSLFDVRDSFCSPLSTITITDRQVRTAAPSNDLVCRFQFQVDVKLKAFCDGLFCISAKKYLYLWNPSTGACKKLPDAPPLHTDRRWLMRDVTSKVFYGLGRDAAADDDYKLLKIWIANSYIREKKLHIYYSKSDSWRDISIHSDIDFLDSNGLLDSHGLFVNGALHWVSCYSNLFSFDFSTEKFRVLGLPPCSLAGSNFVDVAVLSEKLCVFVNYIRSIYTETAFVLWAMEDYGVVESWTKLYEISYKSIPPSIVSGSFILRPLYLYDDGRIVVWACSGYQKSDIIVYQGSEVVAHSKIVATRGNGAPAAGNPRSRVCGGFVYVESLVSPAT